MQGRRRAATILCIPLLLLIQSVWSQRPCEQRSCYPATGDLLVGRENKLYASSTCGLRRPTKYCIVGFLLENSKCFYCDSRQIVDSRPDGYVFSHLPKYMVSRSPDNRLKTWWQAENGVEKAFIQLDLEAEFHFTHLIMTFKTFRPAGMIVEKSADFGRTWHAYRYFAYDCKALFPTITKRTQTNIDDVICEERYSQAEPSTEGEVVLKVLDPLIPVANPYSLEVQNLLKLTNLRVTFTKLRTLGDDLLDVGANVQDKYYYALYEMVIRGSCSCYGHADECVPTGGAQNDPNMVHGQCSCSHFTKGRNCEMCLDGYWDLPWRPALGDQTNACKKCNCHGHTARCHFDVAVYKSTGEVSGGVCDDCQHNTTGRQCGECIALFYRDPAKDISDPSVCLPCNCDPAGSIGGGECEATTDLLKGTIAGRCICKANVVGERCDRCRAGHWNLLESDPDGCQSCSCDSRGTVGNNLCDSITGQCTCKRFVEGTKCNQCYDGFWGVGSSPDGCTPCDCDLGGAFSTTCDKITGSCSCRPNIIGRKCDKVRPGYFYSLPDQDPFEAEDAVPSRGTFTKVIGDPLGTGVRSTWTGDGFASLPGDAAIDFTMVRVPVSGDFRVYIRYKNKKNVNWDNVEMTVSRTDGRDLSGGPCKEAFLTKTMSAYLQSTLDHGLFQPSVCLQKDLVYNLQLKLPRNQGILRGEELEVDSIFLVPELTSVALFNTREGERLRQIYVSNGCDKHFLSLSSPSRGNIPQKCLGILFSISASINDGALGCQCDPVGTKADGGSDVLVCNAAGGQCPCKPNVIERKCDRCSPGAYGFGPEGCSLCACDLIGSSDRFCNELTGKCKCDGLVEGRQCDRCPPAYFGFPSCEPCDCSNHSLVCHARTGVCLNCKDNTAGASCGACAPGYYGDASIGLPTDCQRCQCPGGSSGNQFSDTCFVQSVNGVRDVVCDNCKPGYTGQFCEKCAQGYFGNPIIQGGSCKKCECNGNIDPSATGKCDAVTGECLSCLHDTEGFYCDKCRPWTFGDAKNQSCEACVCNNLGTDYTSGSVCDRETGQCPCLKNVAGQECDSCAPGFWNLASGTGCERCNCSSDGSLRGQCNQLDGQCECRVGFGGQQCTECEDFYWGNPYEKCTTCLCNPAGSVSAQCDRKTGKCTCKTGVVGERCDMCDARTTGMMPKCESCHPCYDQWDDTLSVIEKNFTADLLPGFGGNVTLNVSGLTQYDLLVKQLMERLDELERLFNASVTAAAVDMLRQRVVDFRAKMMESHGEMIKLGQELKNTSRRNAMAEDELDALDTKVKGLERQVNDLVANLTDIVESNTEGAYNSTMDSLRRSRAAGKSVNSSLSTLAESKMQRETMDEKFYTSNDSSLRVLHKNNMDKLDGLSTNVDSLDGLLDKLNELLCGPSSDCGRCNSSGCMTCAASSNCSGVRRLAMKAVEDASSANVAATKKIEMINGALDQLRLLDVDVQASRNMAEASLQSATEAKHLNEEAVANITALINDILIFLNQSFAHPNDTRQVVSDTLALNISLTPAEITNLAEQIKLTVANLTGVGAILEASKNDLQLAIDLRKEALEAKMMAEKVMNDTMRVIDKLSLAVGRQNQTERMMQMAAADVEKAKAIIQEVNAKHDELERLLRMALKDVERMENDTVPALETNYKENRAALVEAEKAGANATELLGKANRTSNDVRSTLNSVAITIATKNASAEEIRKRTMRLAANTQRLYENAMIKLRELEDLQLRYTRNEKREKDVSEELARLDAQIAIIVEKLRVITKCHTNCNPQTVSFCPKLVD